jgi:hypothetical protein
MGGRTFRVVVAACALAGVLAAPAAPAAAEDVAGDALTLFPTSGLLFRLGEEDQKAVGSFVYRTGAVRLALQASAPLSAASREAAFLSTDAQTGSFQASLVLGYDSYAAWLDGPLGLTPEQATRTATFLLDMQRTYGARLASESVLCERLEADAACGERQLAALDLLRTMAGLAPGTADEPFTCPRLMAHLGEDPAACATSAGIDAVWARHAARAAAAHATLQTQLRRFGQATDLGRAEPEVHWFLGAEVGGGYDRVRAAPVGDAAGARDWQDDWQLSLGLKAQVHLGRHLLLTGRFGVELQQDVATEAAQTCTETIGDDGATTRSCRDVLVLLSEPALAAKGYARLGLDWFFGEPNFLTGALEDRLLPGLELRLGFEELGGDDAAAQARFRLAAFLTSSVDLAAVRSGLAVELLLALEEDPLEGHAAGEVIGVTPLVFVGASF